MHAHRHPTTMPPQPLPVTLRTAELYPQPARRDGVVEFVGALALVCIVFIASVAFVRGTPVTPPQAKQQAAATAAQQSASTAG